ncbi:hypothetical protein BJ508DRAFT_367643 [Ascobolus immersus RN42]|uniref:Uncharacterized protein n=1 Tax=Ascobolus immersus RN42 TaxID=1160509 RepID=A0A3N4HER1_ASCIM|nr:hypothetical protein BJ508DRAFT_367643 [Ascobolus immersus RN42]
MSSRRPADKQSTGPQANSTRPHQTVKKTAPGSRNNQTGAAKKDDLPSSESQHSLTSSNIPGASAMRLRPITNRIEDSYGKSNVANVREEARIERLATDLRKNPPVTAQTNSPSSAAASVAVPRPFGRERSIDFWKNQPPVISTPPVRASSDHAVRAGPPPPPRSSSNFASGASQENAYKAPIHRHSTANMRRESKKTAVASSMSRARSQLLRKEASEVPSPVEHVAKIVPSPTKFLPPSASSLSSQTFPLLPSKGRSQSPTKIPTYQGRSYQTAPAGDRNTLTTHTAKTTDVHQANKKLIPTAPVLSAPASAPRGVTKANNSQDSQRSSFIPPALPLSRHPKPSASFQRPDSMDTSSQSAVPDTEARLHHTASVTSTASEQFKIERAELRPPSPKTTRTPLDTVQNANRPDEVSKEPAASDTSQSVDATQSTTISNGPYWGLRDRFPPRTLLLKIETVGRSVDIITAPNLGSALIEDRMGKDLLTELRQWACLDDDATTLFRDYEQPFIIYEEELGYATWVFEGYTILRRILEHVNKKHAYDVRGKRMVWPNDFGFNQVVIKWLAPAFEDPYMEGFDEDKWLPKSAPYLRREEVLEEPDVPIEQTKIYQVIGTHYPRAVLE